VELNTSEHVRECANRPKAYFATDDGMVQAVDGVDLTFDRGETLGVVDVGCIRTMGNP
jgi:hypothetical protein